MNMINKGCLNIGLSDEAAQDAGKTNIYIHLTALYYGLNSLSDLLSNHAFPTIDQSAAFKLPSKIILSTAVPSRDVAMAYNQGAQEPGH